MSLPTRAEQEQRVIRYRVLTRAGNGVAAAVTAGATTLAVTLPKTESGSDYGVVATPGWATTVWVTGKSTTSFTLNFGSAAPGGGSTVDYFTFRSE